MRAHYNPGGRRPRRWRNQRHFPEMPIDILHFTIGFLYTMAVEKAMRIALIDKSFGNLVLCCIRSNDYRSEDGWRRPTITRSRRHEFIWLSRNGFNSEYPLNSRQDSQPVNQQQRQLVFNLESTHLNDLTWPEAMTKKKGFIAAIELFTFSRCFSSSFECILSKQSRPANDPSTGRTSQLFGLDSRSLWFCLVTFYVDLSGKATIWLTHISQTTLGTSKNVQEKHIFVWSETCEAHPCEWAPLSATIMYHTLKEMERALWRRSSIPTNTWMARLMVLFSS